MRKERIMCLKTTNELELAEAFTVSMGYKITHNSLAVRAMTVIGQIRILTLSVPAAGCKSLPLNACCYLYK